MDGAVDSDDSDLGPALVIGYPVQGFQNRGRRSGDHATLDRRVRDIDHDHVHQGLRRANHVLCGGNILDHGMVEFLSLPTVHGLMCLRVIVERGWHCEKDKRKKSQMIKMAV